MSMAEQVRTSSRSAASRCGDGASSSVWWPSTSIAVPALSARPWPKTTQAVSRCRRKRSPSCTSSCRKAKLCRHSTATAPGIPSSVPPPTAAADSSASPGRTDLLPRRCTGWPAASRQPMW